MTAQALLETLRTRGVHLFAEGDRLRWRGPEEVLSPKVVATLKAAKPALLAILQAEAAPAHRPAICPAAVAWDEERSFNLLRAALVDHGERVPGGTLAWCDEHAPELNDAMAAAEADLDTAFATSDAAGFTAGLVAFAAAVDALAAARQAPFVIAEQKEETHA